MMEDKLIDILGSYGYPVRRQGSLADDEDYPDSFFTFWNADSYDTAKYDGKTCGIGWDFDVNFYSDDPEKTYSVLGSARKELKRQGFIISGKGYDVPSDVDTYTGRGMRVEYLEFDKKGEL